LPRAPLGKLFAERLCRFTECFWHSANLLHPVVGVGSLFRRPPAVPLSRRCGKQLREIVHG
jgi:hypothetical protein